MYTVLHSRKEKFSITYVLN